MRDTRLQLPAALAASGARCPLFAHAFSNTEQDGKNKTQRMQIRKGLERFEIPHRSQLCLHAAPSLLDRTDRLSSINGFDATSASAAFPYPAHIERMACARHASDRFRTVIGKKKEDRQAPKARIVHLDTAAQSDVSHLLQTTYPNPCLRTNQIKSFFM